MITTISVTGFKKGELVRVEGKLFRITRAGYTWIDIKPAFWWQKLFVWVKDKCRRNQYRPKKDSLSEL